MQNLRRQPTVKETRKLVSTLFAKRVDKAGRPYVEHCFRVLELLPSDATDDEGNAALLHDVIEDLPVTAADLRDMGYSDRTIWLVERLTRSKDTDYFDYVRSIKETADVGLIAIKLADNTDNSDQARMSLVDGEYREHLRERYAKARAILADG